MSVDVASLQSELRELPFQVRQAWAQGNLEPVHSDYRVLYEDCTRPHLGLLMLVPDPQWMAMAMFGAIIPPVWVYHALADDEAAEGFVQHTRGYLMDTAPVDAMTEEAAIEYLIQKDVPRHVWQSNSPVMKIVRVDDLPSRNLRAAWSLAT